MTDIVDQPPPIARPEETPAWELVIEDVKSLSPQGPQDQEVLDTVAADMTERDKVGRERYGVPLTAHNGRDHLVDAYQELLDACVYLRANMVEDAKFTHAFYRDILVRTLELRRAIMNRKLKKQ